MKIIVKLKKLRKMLWINVILLTVIKECSAHQFSYDIQEQSKWQDKYPSCGGSSQSPVEIIIEHATSTTLSDIEMNRYDTLLPGPIAIENNGHTITFVLLTKDEVPTIEGSDLTESYELHSFHFHWGLDNNRGSEHTLNGRRFPLELHLVHVNSKHKRNFTEALNDHDGLSVIGIFYEFSQTDGTSLENIETYIKRVPQTGNKVFLENPSFTLRSLFPNLDTRTYFRYMGSLTTPPCDEAVEWIIFPYSHASVTEAQLESFRSLRQSHGEQMADNFRVVQPLNGRQIYIRVNQF